MIALVSADAPPRGAVRTTVTAAAPASKTSTAATPAPAQARETYGRMEMQFEANRGKTDGSVEFLARGAG